MATAFAALAEGESAVHIGKRELACSEAAVASVSDSALTLKAVAAFGEVELLSQNNFFIRSSSSRLVWRRRISKVIFSTSEINLALNILNPKQVSDSPIKDQKKY